MSKSSHHISAGYYGKVPIRGDFVTQHLPPDFIEPWDDWLNGVLLQSQNQLDEKWLEHYLISPVWRFALSTGICGKASWQGVLIPSVDEVGRYFPLTIALSLNEKQNPLQSLMTQNNWFERAEAAARFCLDDDFSFDELDKTLRGLGRVEQDENSPLGCFSGGKCNNAWVLDISSLENLSREFPGLIRQLLTELFFAYSLWWTEGSSFVKPVFLICQGLPPLEGFSAMLDGKWKERGWQTQQIIEINKNGQ